MITKILAGTALAMSAAVAVAAPASATDCPPAGDSTGAAQQAIGSYQMDGGNTTAGEGTYGNHFGDTLAGSQDGVINNNGAPFVDVDLRCAVANPTGVAGVWGNKNSCSNASVDQFHRGGILGG
ncbi:MULTISPECIES: hypothetical protein [Streptacidiphilus]|uniref:Secreted protein n=1 Tax=Streptacidiphilus cavernicola TaxID=3342716 RepID=A0ABV6UPM7_9ACTN|nr:hypothetical protein [Streptacidiphilus jeojiense]